MGWSTQFKAALNEARRQPLYYVETIPSGETDGWNFGKEYFLASHNGLGYGPGIVRGSVRVSGQRVTLQGWGSSLGGFSFDITNNAAPAFVANVKRGYGLRLRMGFPQWDPAAYQTIAVGSVRGLQWNGASYTVTCGDALSLLQTRQDRDRTQVQLFSKRTQNTNSGTAYTAGAPTVEVSSTSGFEKVSSHDGVLRMVPDGAAEFYLTWSGTLGGPPRFQVAGTASFGTTAEDMTLGDKVFEVGYYAGHPLTVFKRILTSTGAATNGSGDVGPETWGFGVASRDVANGDLAQWEAKLAVSSGAYSLDFLSDDQVTNGLGWFISKVQPLGIWPVMREGEYTMRAAQDLQDILIETGITIGDNDIARLEGWELWASEVQGQYGNFKLGTASGAGSGSSIDKILGLPASQSFEGDASGTVYGNESAIRIEVQDRIANWYQAVPETVSLTLKGWGWAQLVPGDVVRLTTRLQGGHNEQGGTYNNKAFMVTKVDPFVGADTRVSLATYNHEFF